MAQAENQIGREVKKSTVREVNQLIAYSVGDPLYDTEVKEEQQFWKRILIVDDEFKPNFYDLLLIDINMSHMNGIELCEKILAIDINVRICFMSSLAQSTSWQVILLYAPAHGEYV